MENFLNKLLNKLMDFRNWYIDKCENRPILTFIFTMFAVIFVLSLHKLLVLTEDIAVILWNVIKLFAV